MKLRTGDKVTVIAGADKGKSGKILKVLNDKVELIRDLFKGFYYGHFATTTYSDKYEIIMAGANWMLETEEKKKAFMKYSYDVKSLYALCTGALSQKLKDEIASKVDDINFKQHHIDYFVKEYQKKHRL